MARKDYDVCKLEFVADINGLASSGTLTVDTAGDTMVLPQGFVVDSGWAHIAAGTTNNSVDIGVLGGDTDAFVDGANNSSAAVKTNFLATGTGIANTAAAGLTVVITNAGAAAIPSAATLVTVSLTGHYEY